MDGLIVLTYVVPIVCIGAYAWLVQTKHGDGVIGLLLLVGGSLASFAFWMPLVFDLPLTWSAVGVGTLLIPGAWLIIPACFALVAGRVVQIPSWLRVNAVGLAIFGTFLQLFWWSLLALSDLS